MKATTICMHPLAAQTIPCYPQYMDVKKPNRQATHQVLIRLTDQQRDLVEQACRKQATSYGIPSMSRFLLVEGLEAAKRITTPKSKPKDA